MNKMKTKSQILKLLSEQTGLSKKDVSSFFDVLAKNIETELKTNNGFVFPGIGKFVCVHRKERMGFNPIKGEKILIPSKTSIKFRIAKAIKDIKVS